MRIISGQFKGRKLTPPKDDAIRPTSEMARESLFNLLMHGQFGGGHIIGQRVADICSGTGALGIEALSRGATHCTFVDFSKAAVALTEKNVAHVGATHMAQCMLADAKALPKAREPFALVMMDPPYGDNILPDIVRSLMKQGWLQAGSLLATEMLSTRDVPPIEGATMLTERRYGKAKIVIWEVMGG